MLNFAFRAVESDIKYDISNDDKFSVANMSTEETLTNRSLSIAVMRC